MKRSIKHYTGQINEIRAFLANKYVCVGGGGIILG